MRRVGLRSPGAVEAACAEGRAGMADRDVVMEVPFMPPAVGMDQWTLSFTDAALESCYRAERFRGSCTVIVAFVGALMVSLAMIAVVHPPLAIPCVATIAGQAVWISYRLWLHRSVRDQERASLHWGRATNSIVVWVWICINSFERPRCSIGAMQALVLLWFTCPIYFRFSGMHNSHRLTYVAVSVAGLSTGQTFSELGHRTELLWVTLGLCLSELVGYTLELLWRRSY